MVKRYLRSKVKSKTVIFIIVALLAFSLLPLISTDIIYSVAPYDKTSKLQLNYCYYFSPYTVTFLLSPLYLIWLEFQFRYFDKTYLILRISDIRRYFLTRIFLIAVESLSFTVLIYVFILFREICFDNQFAVSEFPGLAGNFLIQLSGFFTLALVFYFVSTVLDTTLIGGISTYLFVIADFAFLQSGVDFSIIVFRTLCRPFSGYKNYLSSILFILMLDIVICANYYNILKHKQFLK